MNSIPLKAASSWYAAAIGVIFVSEGYVPKALWSRERKRPLLMATRWKV